MLRFKKPMNTRRAMVLLALLTFFVALYAEEWQSTDDASLPIAERL